MNKAIEIVPALKRLELKHVGCWENLRMDFLPGLNIITDDDRGLGKSTILRAILKAVRPSAQMDFPPTPTQGCPEGDISVELMSSLIKVRISRSSSVLAAPEINETHSRSTLNLLRFKIRSAPLGTAILIENEVTASFNARDYPEAVELLNASPRQVICIIARYRGLDQFRQARIFTCHWDQESNGARVRIDQVGEARN